MHALDKQYGFLLEEALLQEIKQVGLEKTIAQATTLMEIGQPIQYMPLLLSGVVKVMRQDAKEDELLLYFLEKGDTCAMTLQCTLQGATSKVHAVTETQTTLVLIPIQYMELWMAKYKTWRSFILESYHMRFNELLQTLDSIAFLKMDMRLLKYLKDKAMVTNDDIIYATHQEIAQDLHTSRVVISRLLKKLEQQGAIKMQRNHIQVIML